MLRVLLRSFTLLTLLLYLTMTAQAAIIRVPQDQPGLAEAVNAAASGDSIELADGVYQGLVLNIENKSLTIRSASGNPSACAVKNSTISFAAGNIDTYASYTLNISGITVSDNSTIEGYDSAGRWETEANVTISNCIFERNGRYVIGLTAKKVTITHCTFRGSGSDGLSTSGAILLSALDLVVTDCLFARNTGEYLLSVSGWSIFYYGRAVIARCRFENNALTSGSPLNVDMNVAAQITDCHFTDNSGSAAGAIYTRWSYPLNSLSIHNSTFRNNTGATSAGAISATGAELSVSNSTFLNNQVSGSDPQQGGAISCGQYGPATIVNSTFVGNRANNGGGAIHNVGNERLEFPEDDFYLEAGPLSIGNCVLWDNTVTSGSGQELEQVGPIAVVIQNCLIRNYPGLTSTPDANGNFSADPLFVRNPATNGPDDLGDLRLLPNSPAINAGNNSLLLPDTHDLDNDGDTTEPVPLDLALNPRINTNTVDLGAFEYQNQAPVANGQNLVTNQDTPLSITLSASDSDGESLTYATGQPSHGTLSGTAPNLTYTPNTGYAGSDSFTFRVTDAYGATSNTATISLIVKDKTAPVITLNGANPMSINQGSTFTDPGATAIDNVDGTVPVTVSGSVNTAAPGSYTLTYSAKDATGNIASKTRTVNVIAVATPKITVTTLGIARIGPLVGVVVKVTNTGNTAATNVRVTGANLIGLDAFLIAPCDSFRLNPGKSQEVLLTFFPLTKGQKGNLSVQGTSSVGAFGLSQTVTIP